MRTLCLAILLLGAILPTDAKGPKKKKGGDDANAAMVPCESTFFGVYAFEGNQSRLNEIMAPYSEPAVSIDDGGYNVTLQSDDPGYIGADYNQVIDEWGSYLFDDFLRGACDTYDLGGVPFPRGESRLVLFEDSDGNAGDGPHYHVEYDYNSTDWDRTYEQYDVYGGEHTYQTHGLPRAESPCDPDSSISNCKRYSPPKWRCNISDLTAFQERMRAIYKMVADDCWTVDGINWPITESKCEGAPKGAITCTGTPLRSTETPVGLKVTVNGARCSACSLKGDFCPGYYDVYTCSYEWATSATAAVNTTFEFQLIVNSAYGLGPAAWLLCILGAIGIYMQQL